MVYALLLVFSVAVCRLPCAAPENPVHPLSLAHPPALPDDRQCAVRAGAPHSDNPVSQELTYKLPLFVDLPPVAPLRWRHYGGLRYAEVDKDHDHQSSNFSQYDLSGSQPGTPAADIAIKAGVASS